jgi:ABC-type oligopeptide transport system substrate-binding subunit
MKTLSVFWKQIASASLALLLLAGCGSGGDAIQINDTREPGVLYRVLEDEATSLDPHKISVVVDSRIAKDLFEGLTTYREDGTVGPGLAERWTVTPDGLTWTFRLRPNLTFSDGTPLNATSVKESVRRLLDPKTAAPYASIIFPVANAEAANRGDVPIDQVAVRVLDPLTIEYRLRAPLPRFVELLAHSSQVVVPAHTIRQHGERWTRPENFVGSGAFVLRSWRLQDQLVMDKNPRYHGAATVALTRVVYQPISDDTTAIRKFRAHQVDIVQDIPTQRLDLLRREVPDAIKTFDWRGTYYVSFNNTKPPFNDVRVRQALSMSVDRAIITDDVLQRVPKPSAGFVPAGLGGYGPAIEPSWMKPPLEQRVARARALLAEAGYGPENQLEFEMRYNTDEDHKRVMLTLMQLWKPLNVRVRLLNSEASVHFATLKQRDYTAARAGWIGDFSAPENFLYLWETSTGPMNYSGFSDPEFDRLMQLGYAEADPERRIAKFRAAEAYGAELAPVMPIYTYRTKNLISPDVIGWIPNYENENPSKYLSVRRGGSQLGAVR